MKNSKLITTFIALAMVILPAVSFADGTYHYGNEQFIESIAVPTVGVPVQNGQSTVNTSGNTSPTEAMATYVGAGNNNSNSSGTNILGFHIKSKAERDAEKAAELAQAERNAEAARVARNNDGTFAYGYTNANGAQYASGAQYVDARTTNGKYTASARNAYGNSRNTASVGSVLSNGFLPTTFGGWVLLLLLIGILVAIIRAFKEKFYARPVHVHAHH